MWPAIYANAPKISKAFFRRHLFPSCFKGPLGQVSQIAQLSQGDDYEMKCAVRGNHCRRLHLRCRVAES